MRPRLMLIRLAGAAMLAPLAPAAAWPASAAAGRPACQGGHPMTIYVSNIDDFVVTPIRTATSTPLKAITLKAGLAAIVIAR